MIAVLDLAGVRKWTDQRNGDKPPHVRDPAQTPAPSGATKTRCGRTPVSIATMISTTEVSNDLVVAPEGCHD